MAHRELFQSPAHGTSCPMADLTEHWARRPEQVITSQPFQCHWLGHPAPGRKNTWVFSSRSIGFPGNSVGSEYTYLPLHNGLVPP